MIARIFPILSCLLLGQSVLSAQSKSEIHIYKTIDTLSLNVELIYPDQISRENPKPTMVFFFGGGWNSGTIEQFRPQAEYFASRGMLTALADYRVKTRHDSTPFDAVRDAKSAVRFLRENHAKLGIDPKKIVAAGGSAGGHLAAATGNVEGLEEPNEDLNITSKPDALILFNPVFDNGPDQYGYDRIGGRYLEISPKHNISEGAPPTLVLFGTNDRLVDVPTIESYDDAMEAVGSRCETVLYDGATHGFFNLRSLNYYVNTVKEADIFLNSLGYIEGPPSVEFDMGVTDLSRGDSLVQAGDLFPAITAYRKSYEKAAEKSTAFKLARTYALQAQFMDKAFEYLSLADLDTMEPLWNADLYFMTDDPRWKEVEETQLEKLSSQVTGDFDKEYARQLLNMRMKEWVNRYHVMLTFRSLGQNSPILSALSHTMQKHHKENEILIQDLLDANGWPKLSAVGAEAAYAAGNVINHSDLETRQKYLPMLKAVCEEGEGDWSRYAHILDRTELELGNPQVFGTQMEQDPKTKIYKPRPIADPDNVDALRASKEMETLKTQLDRFNESMKRDFGDK